MLLIMAVLGIIFVFSLVMVQLAYMLTEIDKYYENNKDTMNRCTAEDYKFSVHL